MKLYGNTILTGAEALYVDTSMTERSFAQLKMPRYLDEAGILAVPVGEDSFSFQEWKYTGTTLKSSVPGFGSPGEKGDTLLLQGSPYDGVPLYELLTAPPSREGWRVVRQTVRAYQAALDAGIRLPCVGPLGILAGTDGSLLFLPPALFSRCVSALGTEASAAYMGAWCFDAGSALGIEQPRTASYTFSAASFVYAALTGAAPFPGADDEKRHADFYDHNFTPLEYAAANVDGRLAAVINACLNAASSRKRESIKETRELVPADIYAVLPAEREACFIPGGETEEWRKKRNAFMRNRDKKVRGRRFARRYGGVIAGIAAAICIVGIVVFSIVKDTSGGPTTVGMTPLQVTETFYTAFGKLDQETADACVEKNAAKEYTNFLSTMYVTSKVRQAYERQRSTLSPGQWFNTVDPRQEWVFGVTHLEIEESPSSTSEHPVFSVSFYLLTPQPPESAQDASESADTASPVPDSTEHGVPEELVYPLSVSFNRDTVTLSYNKNRWLICSIVNDGTENVPVNMDEFFAQYATGKESNQDEFPWAPGQMEIEEGLRELRGY